MGPKQPNSTEPSSENTKPTDKIDSKSSTSSGLNDSSKDLKAV